MEEFDSENSSMSSKDSKLSRKIKMQKNIIKKSFSFNKILKSPTKINIKSSTQSMDRLSTKTDIKTRASSIDNFSLNNSEKVHDFQIDILSKSLSNEASREPIKYVASQMGTTLNVVLIVQEFIYVANLGDSLAVIFRNGIAEKLSTEHKISVECERKRIENSGARIINNRIEGRLNLTRAIGINQYFLLIKN